MYAFLWTYISIDGEKKPYSYICLPLLLFPSDGWKILFIVPLISWESYYFFSFKNKSRTDKQVVWQLSVGGVWFLCLKLSYFSFTRGRKRYSLFPHLNPNLNFLSYAKFWNFLMIAEKAPTFFIHLYSCMCIQVLCITLSNLQEDQILHELTTGNHYHPPWGGVVWAHRALILLPWMGHVVKYEWVHAGNWCSEEFYEFHISTDMRVF